MTDLATCDHLFMSRTTIFLLLTTICIDTCAKAGHIVLGLNPSIIYGVEDPVFLWRRHRCEVSKNRHNLACSLSSSGRDSLRMNARIIRGKLAKTRHTSPTNSPVFLPPHRNLQPDSFYWVVQIFSVLKWVIIGAGRTEKLYSWPQNVGFLSRINNRFDFHWSRWRSDFLFVY